MCVRAVRKWKSATDRPGTLSASVLRRIVIVVSVGCSPVCACSDTQGSSPSDAGSDAGGHADAGPVCGEVALPRMRACARWEDDADDDQTSAAGVVLEVRAGEWACENDGLGDSPARGEIPSAWTVRIDDDGRVLAASFLLPWTTPLVEPGDRVQLEYRVRWTLVGPPVWGTMDLRAPDGAPIVWMGIESGPSRLAPLPVPWSLSRGEVACFQQDECFDWQGFELLVAPDSGDEVAVAYGAKTQVGDYVVLHGGYSDIAPGSSVECTDVLESTLRVGIVRGDLDMLEAGAGGTCGKAACTDDEYCAVPDTGACDRANASATCKPRPEHCDPGCPGVCGCNGDFYCNACRAARRGVAVAPDATDCQQAGCTGGVAEARNDLGCFRRGWTCYGRSYDVSCKLPEDGGLCECLEDGVVIDTFAMPVMGDCDPLDELCGFPPPDFSAP